MYYTPAIMIQAEDRVHRIGQENNVNVHYLYGAGTIDDLILPILFSKFNIVSSTLDDKVSNKFIIFINLNSLEIKSKCRTFKKRLQRRY